MNTCTVARGAPCFVVSLAGRSRTTLSPHQTFLLFHLSASIPALLPRRATSPCFASIPTTDRNGVDAHHTGKKSSLTHGKQFFSPCLVRPRPAAHVAMRGMATDKDDSGGTESKPKSRSTKQVDATRKRRKSADAMGRSPLPAAPSAQEHARARGSGKETVVGRKRGRDQYETVAGRTTSGDSQPQKAPRLQGTETGGAGQSVEAPPSLTKAEMTEKAVRVLGQELTLPAHKVRNAVQLFEDGATLPFIARYRKEATGGMDEVQLHKLQDALERFHRVESRRQTVLASLGGSELLSAELRDSVLAAGTLTEIEDLYLPFKPKRRTRASAARDRGLQPLADLARGVLSPPFNSAELLALDPLKAAARLVNTEQGVSSPEEALAGAQDILAEELTEEAQVRATARRTLQRTARVESREKASGADQRRIYANYHNFSSPLSLVRPHQALAVRRGVKEKVLSMKVTVDDNVRDSFLSEIVRGVLARSRDSSQWKTVLQAAVSDGFNRLLQPALEREWWSAVLEEAEASAVEQFAVNLRAKLLQPPVKDETILAIDPAYRTGCKVAVTGATGDVLATAVVFSGKPEEAASTLTSLLRKHACKTIALGNGQGSREAEEIVRAVVEQQPDIKFTVVDEAGASVYSASAVASSELPSLDVSLRGAVSLGRRVQDPLAELVKIAPRHLGAGLYQHDLDAKRLERALDRVVESAVNTVGVDLNSGSPALLRHVAGLRPAVADNIVEFRQTNGVFRRREELLKVSGVGPAAFQQAAGFLRVYGGDEELDATAIHPESYRAAKTLLERFGFELGRTAAPDVDQVLASTPAEELAASLDVGPQTLQDMLHAVANPKHDPRFELDSARPRSFVTAHDLGKNKLALSDVTVGTCLKGVVQNVVDFGAFVDLGFGFKYHPASSLCCVMLVASIDSLLSCLFAHASVALTSPGSSLLPSSKMKSRASIQAGQVIEVCVDKVELNHASGPRLWLSESVQGARQR